MQYNYSLFLGKLLGTTRRLSLFSCKPSSGAPAVTTSFTQCVFVLSTSPRAAVARFCIFAILMSQRLSRPGGCKQLVARPSSDSNRLELCSNILPALW
mmetsp:Transcript_917/g.1997  ORF Transcript_917/g.1997 Transcript_917/m.1997 type:complete len:98 (-) Transcript_917:1581-1874(-)